MVNDEIFDEFLQKVCGYKVSEIQIDNCSQFYTWDAGSPAPVGVQFGEELVTFNTLKSRFFSFETIMAACTVFCSQKRLSFFLRFRPEVVDHGWGQYYSVELRHYERHHESLVGLHHGKSRREVLIKALIQAAINLESDPEVSAGLRAIIVEDPDSL